MTLLAAKQITVCIGKKTICQQFDFSIKAGEVWGILGPNGSGKSTLLHALAGLHPLADGEIWLGKKQLPQEHRKAIAQQLAILFQDNPESFPQTVWEYCCGARFPHLAYFQQATVTDQEIVLEALQRMELAPHQHHLITQLSGGEKRRLAIAATLAQTPAIFLLDEPTNHLDIRHQMQTLQHFCKLARTESKAILMSLHDVNLAQQFCDHVLLLFADGSNMQGPTSQLLTPHNLSRLFNHPMTAIPAGSHIYWQPML